MGVLSIEQVLTEEAQAILGQAPCELISELHDLSASQDVETQRANKDADQRSGRDEKPDWVNNRRKFYCRLNRLNRAALCFSGGGIRSATFCLGILQALAGHKLQELSEDSDEDQRTSQSSDDQPDQSLLRHFHYLSTVSGGGYIGSWLSAWRHYDDFPTVWKSLRSRPDGPDVEPAEISWLRAYSNYLTPRIGLASADTWAGIAIYVRNLILNWLVIVPALAAVLLGLKFVATFAIGLARLENAWTLHFVIGLVGVASLVVAQRFTTTHRPTRRRKPGSISITEKGNVRRVDFLRGNLLWSFISAVLLTSALSSITGTELAAGISTYGVIVLGALLGAMIFAGGWIAGSPLNRSAKDFGWWAASGLVYGGVVGLGMHLYAALMPYSYAGKDAIWMILLPLVFGVPWILVAQLFASTVFVGLTSYEVDSGADREWLASAAGWVAALAVIWILTTFIVFAGGYFFVNYASRKALALYLAPGGGIAGGMSAWIAKRATAAIKTRAADKGSGLISAVVFAIAGPVFAAALVAGISVGLDLLLLGDSLINVLVAGPVDVGPILGWFAAGFAVAFLAAGLASRKVNINRFSLHALYRDRLVRAYLGASRQQRSPDRFTGFDAADNLPVHSVWPPQRAATGDKDEALCLFHVVNITLNLVKSTRLAWQQRKAESFTVSPLHCGAANKGFRKSVDYAAGRETSGISLGTAMAISGAAASPNMGYHSSPSVTLLLALFNVRLGWWLGNPGEEGGSTYKKDGPSTAVWPLIEETFGLTTDENPWVYLSDGGHFENLGIYEMVRRRCRFILAVDAGCDPNFEFEDLGNAIRKIRIDLGINIRFASLDKLKNRPSAQDGRDDIPYHAIGTIHYQDADGPESEDGTILYIKPAYHGTSKWESAGVRSYAMQQKAFPHEPTSDQWFNESQFESYRALALDIVNNVLVDAKAKAVMTKALRMKALGPKGGG